MQGGQRLVATMGRLVILQPRNCPHFWMEQRGAVVDITYDKEATILRGPLEDYWVEIGHARFDATVLQEVVE